MVTRADLIEVYEIIHGLSAVRFSTFFELSHNERTRGHSLKLQKKTCYDGSQTAFLFGQDRQRVELIKRRHNLGFNFEQFQRKTTKIA